MDKKQLLFRELAESFTDKMRVVYNQDNRLQDPSRMSTQEKTQAMLSGQQIDGSIFASKESSSGGNFNDAIGEAAKAFEIIDMGDMKSIQQLNPDMKLLYGVTGDLPLDYLTLKGAPSGFDKLLDIRNLAQFYFMPRKALNNRGKLQNVKTLKDYYDNVKGNSGIYFGGLEKKNLLVKEEIATIDRNSTGGNIERNELNEAEVIQLFHENVLGC
jgi:hypothetical protein